MGNSSTSHLSSSLAAKIDDVENDIHVVLHAKPEYGKSDEENDERQFSAVVGLDWIRLHGIAQCHAVMDLYIEATNVILQHLYYCIHRNENGAAEIISLCRARRRRGHLLSHDHGRNFRRNHHSPSYMFM